jgi:hypothetical protein
MKRYLFIITIAVLLVIVHAAHAAVLTIAPPSSSNEIVISLNTQGDSINAIEGHFTFNPQEFTIENLNDGGSVIDLWVESPTSSNALGTLDFSGIIPGGITTASGTVLTLTIIPVGASATKGFTLTSARALLNNGKGTPAALSIMNGPFILTPTLITSSTASTTVDTQPPDPFIPEIATNTNIFAGQYFIVFGTTDEQSGIDHYEVLEVPAGKSIGSVAAWQPATSPYLLKDQSLSSDIYVRAIDKAGNVRIVKIPAEHPSVLRTVPWLEVSVGGLVIIVLVLFLFLWYRKRR